MDKHQQRQLAYAARKNQSNKDALSATILGRFISTAWYRSSRTVLWYAHCRTEVRTLPMLDEALASGKRIVLPYCTTGAGGEKQLGLWRLEAVEELTPGTWNILEPPRERWLDADRRIDAAELDAVMVPGVAFDRQGGRLGNGAGYYDRLLNKVRSDAVLAAVCFESQLLPEVLMAAHDAYMNFVITEEGIYLGRRPLRR